MPRQSVLQRWSNLVLLATLISLVLYDVLPLLVSRLGRAWEQGRHDVAAMRTDRIEYDFRREQIADVRRRSELVLPAVVRVGSRRLVSRQPAGPVGTIHSAMREASEETLWRCGLVIGRDGLILTNYDAIVGAREILVHFSSLARICTARIIGGDSDTDLAVLQIEPPIPDLTTAELNPLARVTIGERVVAVGDNDGPNPSLWVGSVRAEGSAVPAAGCLPQDFVRTTAVNSRNAGGPLLNANGDVVGICSFVAHEMGDFGGMVVPAAVAAQVVAELRDKGSVERGWLGVFVHRIDRFSYAHDEATAYALDYVVPESPAGRAGLRAGDLIVRVSGQAFPNAGEFHRRIAVTRPSTELTITLIHEGRTIEQRIVVGARPATPVLPPGEAEWGVRYVCLSSEERERAGLNRDAAIVIQAVADQARLAGLYPGDTIIEVNGAAIRCVDEFCEAVRRWRESAMAGAVEFIVESRGERKRVEMTPAEQLAQSESR